MESIGRQPKVKQIAQELLLAESARGEPVLFHGNSMLPLFRDGDELRLAPVTWAEIAPGDIVTYRLENKFPTLRVVAKGKSKLTLMGDNWPQRYEAWPEHILGRVVARTRAGVTISSGALAWRLRAEFAVLSFRASVSVNRAAGSPRRIWSAFTSRRRQRFATPPNIQVNVSSNCNLKCRMCPYLSVHGSSEHLDFMDSSTFERILPLIKSIGAVHFSGSGEPLFNRSLFDFMARVRHEVPGATIDLTSNGTLLTEEKARKLVEHKVNKIHVSFDGLPERVGSIRRGVNGSKVVENIRRLSTIKREAGSTLPVVQVNYMTGYGTYWDLVSFIHLAREIGVGEIQLLEMQPATAEDISANLYTSSQQDNGQALKTAVMLARYYNIKLHLPLVTKNACYYPYNPHVGEDGEVYPCCFLDYRGRQLYHDDQEHFLPPITFGNIRQQSFDDIWNGDDYIALRERNTLGEFDANCQLCYDIRLRTAERIEQILDLR